MSTAPNVKPGDRLLHHIPEDGAWYTITVTTVMVADRKGRERLEVTYDDFPEDDPCVILTKDVYRLPEPI